jgi:hypothetical protein
MSNYDDIIHLPHHVSKRHPQMSMWSRAAQFAPFAALTGLGAAIRRAAEHPDEQVYFDDEMMQSLYNEPLDDDED